MMRERRVGAAPDPGVVVHRLEYGPGVAVVGAQREQPEDRLAGYYLAFVALEVHPDPRLPVLRLGIVGRQVAGGAELLVGVVASEGGPPHPHAAHEQMRLGIPRALGDELFGDATRLGQAAAGEEGFSASAEGVASGEQLRDEGEHGISPGPASSGSYRRGTCARRE